jgi:hypothetical protein
MIEPETPDTTTRTTASARRWGAAAALVAAGLAGGILLTGTVSANAADGTPTPSSSASAGTHADQGDGSRGTPPDASRPQRDDETLLTGDTAEKVTAAALEAYPGASIDRVETDSDGVYEAHLVTADGTHVVVAVDAAFAVTGATERGDGPGGCDGRPGGDGRPADSDETPSAVPSA